ncbi:MAG: hypothetical protein GF398_22015 [Chitinivibrionales bacterium]|nr:hypothetical protein [Chitinivibrionales bacterium]
MKLKCLIAVCIIGIHSLAHADVAAGSLNLGASLGIGLGIGAQSFGSATTVNSSGNTTGVDDKYHSMGKGIKIDVVAAYGLMDNVFADVAIGFNGGIPATQTESKNENAGTTTILKRKFAQLQFNTHFVSVFEAVDLLDVYIGIGPGLLFTFSSLEGEYQQATLGDYEVTVDEKFSPSFVFNAKAGAIYPVSETIALTGEIAFQAFSTQLREYEVEKSNVPVNISVFYPFLSEGASQKYEEDVTDRPAPTKYPGSNFSVKFGIRFSIL